jgi:hypothetical protein
VGLCHGGWNNPTMHGVHCWHGGSMNTPVLTGNIQASALYSHGDGAETRTTMVLLIVQLLYHAACKTITVMKGCCFLFGYISPSSQRPKQIPFLFFMPTRITNHLPYIDSNPTTTFSPNTKTTPALAKQQQTWVSLKTYSTSGTRRGSLLSATLGRSY